MSTPDSPISPQNTPRATQLVPRTIVFLMVIAALNTIGIGIFMPVLAFIVKDYVSQPNLASTVGLLASAYAICQFLAAPGLGALSDRFGRRPILLICLLGSAFGYTLFGVGGALWVLFLGRSIDGVTGGTVSILMAYVADRTEPKERSKYFGRLGAIVGAGFMIGPAIGGFVSRFGYNKPAYLAAGVTALSLIWGYFFLPESLSDDRRATTISFAQLNLFKQLGHAFAIPQLRWLLTATFFFSLPSGIVQSSMTVLIIDSLAWNADLIGYVFLLIGVMDIVMQGVLSERLLLLFGEVKLMLIGLICLVLAYGVLGTVAIVPSAIVLFASISLFAIGTGFLEPSFRGILSQVAEPHQQGVVQGGNQSIQSLAMVIGPLVGGTLYTQVGHVTPFWFGACMVVLAIIATRLAAPTIHVRGTLSKASQPSAAESTDIHT